MPYDFGDIVLVRFPYTDQAAFKKRPAVVASSRSYNDSKRDIVVMAVTSQFRPAGGLGEVSIHNWQAAKLLRPSAIKPVFATVEQRLILRRLGVLPPDDQAALRRAIFRCPRLVELLAAVSNQQVSVGQNHLCGGPSAYSIDLPMLS